MSYRIRACTRQDVDTLVVTIRGSFRDVAERFGLNEENCPRHPSNCRADWVEKDMARGVTYYVLEYEWRVAGNVALEWVRPGLCNMERLAVLPHWRRQPRMPADQSNIFSLRRSALKTRALLMIVL